MTCKPEMARPLTLEDIEELESLIDKYGVDGVIRMYDIKCGNQQRCLHFRLLLEDPFEQLSGIVKNVDRHGKPALFLIMTDRCLKII